MGRFPAYRSAGFHSMSLIRFFYVLGLLFIASPFISSPVFAETIPANYEGYQYSVNPIRATPLLACKDGNASVTATTNHQITNHPFQYGCVLYGNVSFYVAEAGTRLCPVGQNWTLSGSSCTRPDCVLPQVRNATTGICETPVLTCNTPPGTVVSQGWYNIGTDAAAGQANFPVTSCSGNCSVTFNSTGLGFTLVAGVKTYFYEGSMIVAGGTPAQNYCSSNNSPSPQSATLPPSTCPSGQVPGYVNGVQLCYTPASPPPPGAAPPVTTTKTTSTATNPDQSTTTTTTATNPDGSQTITSTTTDPNGNTSTTTQQVAPPDPAAADQFCSENPDAEVCQKKSECEKNPDVVGCAKLGDVPGSEDFLTKEIPITFNPVSMPGNATCPAPINTVHGVVIDFDPICQYAAGIRPVFLAVAYLSAALIIIGGFKESA